MTLAFQRYRHLMEKCIREGEFLSFETHLEWLSCYERDAQPLHAKLPLLVFRPHTIHHIAPFMAVCHQLEIPVSIRCGGTGLAGGCVPGKEGVVLLTGHLKQIRDYDSVQGSLSIEPGVTPRELNCYAAEGGWHFPLSMATAGVAGIAGCLSSQARGYHQQQKDIYEAIEQVLLVDGQGQIVEVPGSLVCGAEGLWGVIIEMKMQLKKRPLQWQGFVYSGSWQDILAQFPLLRSLQSLSSVNWIGNCFYLELEGDCWRLPSSAAYLTKVLPGIQQYLLPLKLPNKDFLPSRQNFVVISCVFATNQLPKACVWAMEQALELQLECLQQADLLAGSLHLILQAEESLYVFAEKIKQFLIVWTDFVDSQQGELASCHGVGMQMQPYMPPFWTEESRRIWHNLQEFFDSKKLLSKDRFFPVMGKSLEKMRQV